MAQSYAGWPEQAFAVEGDGVDLALRQPGAAAREQARLAREAAPVRSVLASLLGVHTTERAWRIGAKGEELVAVQLAKLATKDPRWRALHSIPVGNRDADIDHFVIGPGGVFTLNTKHHPGGRVWVAGDTFMVNGVRHPYMRNSRHEAARAARLLSAACGLPVAVTGLVVPVNADSLVIKSRADDVHVVARWQLRRWLRRQRECLDEATVGLVYEAARRPATWR